MLQRGKRRRILTIPIFSSDSGADAAAMRLLCAARLEDWKDQMRIDEVRRLLSQTDHSIIDVTMSVGYCSPSHFACVFRQLAGVTPSVQSKQAAGTAASQAGTRHLDHRQRRQASGSACPDGHRGRVPWLMQLLQHGDQCVAERSDQEWLDDEGVH